MTTFGIIIAIVCSIAVFIPFFIARHYYSPKRKNKVCDYLFEDKDGAVFYASNLQYFLYQLSKGKKVNSSQCLPFHGKDYWVEATWDEANNDWILHFLPKLINNGSSESGAHYYKPSILDKEYQPIIKY